jgi:hypothetical protein
MSIIIEKKIHYNLYDNIKSSILINIEDDITIECQIISNYLYNSLIGIDDYMMNNFQYLQSHIGIPTNINKILILKYQNKKKAYLNINGLKNKGIEEAIKQTTIEEEIKQNFIKNFDYIIKNDGNFFQ